MEVITENITMDNNVAEEALAVAEEMATKTYSLKSVAIGGGVAVGVGAVGYLLYTKVIKPAIARAKHKKNLEEAKRAEQEDFVDGEEI